MQKNKAQGSRYCFTTSCKTLHLGYTAVVVACMLALLHLIAVKHGRLQQKLKELFNFLKFRRKKRWNERCRTNCKNTLIQLWVQGMMFL